MIKQNNNQYYPGTAKCLLKNHGTVTLNEWATDFKSKNFN